MRLISAILGLLPVALATDPQLRWMPQHFERAAAPAPAASSMRSQVYWAQQASSQQRHLCYVKAGNGTDDAPAILNALNNECRSKSLIVFPDSLYNIQTVMNTPDLDDVLIHQFGTMLWSSDVDYWLNVSMPMGFQNQSTVWFFGGDHVLWDGHGVGTLNGNGQYWYDW